MVVTKRLRKKLKKAQMKSNPFDPRTMVEMPNLRGSS
jgi:hypothetical protein